jgi:hypothetical protein
MTSEFKTYEKKNARICGTCRRFAALASYCTEYAFQVHKNDDASDCAKYNQEIGK